jgi:hypothetical protein
MKRYVFWIIGAFILVFAGLVYADWTGFTIVNQDLTDLQAGRDNDCPWSIVCDKFGNAHMVWEDKRTNPLQVYYRKRNANGTWQNDQRASYEPNQISYDAFGHPSLCVYYAGDTTKIMVAYIDEHGYGNGNEELRGNTYNGYSWGTSYYISNPDGFLVPWQGSNGGFWSTNMVVGADNYKYAFWEYDNATNLKRLILTNA